MEFKQITPTVFLKGNPGSLQQQILISMGNPGEPAPAKITVKTPKGDQTQEIEFIPNGESQYRVFIAEPQQEEAVTFSLIHSGQVCDRVELRIKPPRHWKVHVVQLSHHDVGYTDLASRVLIQHDHFLDQALDFADQTDDFPLDAQFRITIEQAWSIDHYLKHACPERASKMVERLRQGRFELTATFGNLTSELCGHETLIRALYHSARLKRLYDIPLISAEHNDIPGMSWGLARILTDAGIKLFCPGLPLYYDWGGHGLQSFWDEGTIFHNQAHTPGAFWWQAPGGKKLLVWCNNSGCGGDYRPDMPGLTTTLQKWEQNGYPFEVVRWPVIGAERDNSPYRVEYAQEIRTWNEQWAYPHLVSSTNALFYKDFLPVIASEAESAAKQSRANEEGKILPTWHGELPGQDYPVGATSTARATAVNRNNHSRVTSAEKLACFAALAIDYRYPQELLFDTYEEILWHDEHTWGYHYPIGLAQDAAEHEKALHTFKAAAFIQEVSQKALARIADQVELTETGLHLVILNNSVVQRDGVARTLLRETDNLGSSIVDVPASKDPAGSGYWRGVLLTDRWHHNPPIDLVEGKFDLIDISTNQLVPFQIIPIHSARDPLVYAAQRYGLGEGSQRLGMFETPLGAQRDLCFIARDVPAHGYKTFQLVPREAPHFAKEALKGISPTIENEYYRISFDEQQSRLSEIYDKRAGRNLLDPACPYRFGELLVRTPSVKQEFTLQNITCKKILDGPVCFTLEIIGETFGHPQVTQYISLYAGIPQVYVDTRILKDATPLLDVQLAFPFQIENPHFRYEGGLSILNPIADYLPGAYCDAITVQNWVKVSGGGMNVLWSSLDAPVVSLGGAWQGYVSPAHRAHLDEAVKHPPLKEEDLTRGWIYARLFNNNFGTNFSISQAGDMLFRFVITSGEGEVSDAQAALFGWQAVTPFEHILTEGPRKGMLPGSRSFLQVENSAIVLLTFKQAEDGEGYILRLWNTSTEDVKTNVTMNCLDIAEIEVTNLLEESRVVYATDATENRHTTAQLNDKTNFLLHIPANDLATIRIKGHKSYHS
jgi:hypothetical protein